MHIYFFYFILFLFIYLFPHSGGGGAKSYQYSLARPRLQSSTGATFTDYRTHRGNKDIYKCWHNVNCTLVHNFIQRKVQTCDMLNSRLIPA